MIEFETAPIPQARRDVAARFGNSLSVLNESFSHYEFKETETMRNRGPILVATFAAFVALSHPLLAAPQDYRFETVGAPTKSGKNVLIKVRLVHVPDGKPVTGAIISQSKLDMGPEGMASMTAPVKAIAATEPGIYQFEGTPEMGGNWGLTLAVRVQGETEPVRGMVTVTVPK